MPCEVSREILSAYMDGELSPEKIGEIDGHVTDCAECAEEMALLRAGDDAVAQLVEYGTPRNFETEMRRAINHYRPPRAQWWTLGGRITTRHLTIALCVVCGILLLAGAFLYKDMSQGTLQPVAREDGTADTVTAERPTKKPSNVAKPVKTPATQTQQPLRSTPRTQKEPEPAVPPSPYVGWWMMQVDASPEFEWPVEITQEQDKLVVAAWGKRKPLGKAAVEDGRFVAESEDVSLTLYVDGDASAFSGTMGTSEEGPYHLSGKRVSAGAGQMLTSVRGLDALIGKRKSYGRQMSDALYKYARAHSDRFPTALDDLVPEFMPDLLRLDRDSMNMSLMSVPRMAYSRPSMVPTDELVDWGAYSEEELTVDDRFSLLDQRSLGRLDAFFEEVVVVEWRRFPDGKVIIYLDGSVAYDGMKNVPKLLMPEEHERIAKERERECLRNVGTLGRALVSFAGDHGGLFPSSMEMLWPSYLRDAGALCCPELPAHEIAHEIVCLDKEYPTEDEIELDPELLPSIAMTVEVEDSHRDGFHVVTADGKAVWKPGNER